MCRDQREPGGICPALPVLRARRECQVANPSLLSQEIFGPVLTVYVYPDEKYRETLQLVDSTTSYGLTGAVFAQDK